MKVHTKSMICAMVVAAAVCLAAPLFAQSSNEPAEPEGPPGHEQAGEGRGWHRGPGSPEEHFGAIFKELNLTPEQQKKLDEQRSLQQKRREVLQNQMAQLRKELTTELNKERSDLARVDKLVGQMKVLMGQRIQDRVESILEIKKIMTPGQFQKLNEKMRRFEFRKGGSDEKTSYRHGRSCNPYCRTHDPEFCQRLG